MVVAAEKTETLHGGLPPETCRKRVSYDDNAPLKEFGLILKDLCARCGRITQEMLSYCVCLKASLIG